METAGLNGAQRGKTTGSPRKDDRNDRSRLCIDLSKNEMRARHVVIVTALR
jgi:hypothetical protein